eukprot:2811494-Karenia_brevis.AAC.1
MCIRDSRRDKHSEGTCTDTNVASHAQHAGKWLADLFADQAARRCQLPKGQVRPILKKYQILWQLHSA